MLIRVLEAFAGIGTQRMALRGFEHEVVGIMEIDPHAIKSYEAIHGSTKNFGDISKVKNLPDFDLFTYSFPCTDISAAGSEKGFKKGSGTQSSLLWECERIIEEKRPKYLLLENVKALVFKKNLDGYNEWLQVLEGLGYTNYWTVLNAKDFNIPQNRERVFCVSILGDHEEYKFPEPMELKKQIVDILEDDVDESFYVSEKRTEELLDAFYESLQGKNFLNNMEKEILPIIAASRGRDSSKGFRQTLELNKTANTITTVVKDNYIMERRSSSVFRPLKANISGTLRCKDAGGESIS